jgi:hypothetical protein
VTRVALATCSEFPQLDEDDQALVPALAALGIDAVPVVWDDPFADWGAFDLVVVRNTWDYVGRREELLDWARRAGRVVNSPDVLAWSTDKRYLQDLAAAGLPVVPTFFVEPGGRFPVLEGQAVVKPSESGGARDTERHDPETERDARLLAARIHRGGRTVMVQPYVTGVEARGETALIYFAGTFSHAIHKGPMLSGAPAVDLGLFMQESIAPREPTAQELAVGERVMAYASRRFGPPAYARVDLLPALGGHLVLELELAEPSLFLTTSPGAAERLARVVAGLAAG